MQNITTNAVQLLSTRNTSELCYFLDVFGIFKGKLKAAASRGKYHDSADLRWLANNFKNNVVPHVKKLDLIRVGLAMQRYPELESTFRELHIDVEAAKQAAAPHDVKNLPPLARGDVQLGLLDEAPAPGYTQQPASGYTQQPASGYSQQPASGYTQQPASGYSQQPASGYSQQPASESTSQPASGSTSQPASGQSAIKRSDWNWDETSQNYWLADAAGKFVKWRLASESRSATESTQQPASGYSQQPASGYSQQPASGYSQQPASGQSQQPASGQSATIRSGWNWNETHKKYWLADADGGFARWQ